LQDGEQNGDFTCNLRASTVVEKHCPILAPALAMHRMLEKSPMKLRMLSADSSGRPANSQQDCSFSWLLLKAKNSKCRPPICTPLSSTSRILRMQPPTSSLSFGNLAAKVTLEIADTSLNTPEWLGGVECIGGILYPQNAFQSVSELEAIVGNMLGPLYKSGCATAEAAQCGAPLPMDGACNLYLTGHSLQEEGTRT
jgi:hypothetical protein